MVAGLFVATVRALAVLLYFLATIFSHRQLFQKPGRFYFRLVNCLYCLGCYTAQSTDFSLHLVSGTVSLRLPPVHVTAKLSSARVIELSRTYQYSLLRYDGAHSTKGYVSHLLSFQGVNLYLGYRVSDLGYGVFPFPKP